MQILLVVYAVLPAAAAAGGATPSQHHLGGEWFHCGELFPYSTAVPPSTRSPSTLSGSSLYQDPVTGLQSKLDRGDTTADAVQAVVKNGKLFCMCDCSSNCTATAGPVEVRVTLEHGGRSFSTLVPLSLSCSDGANTTIAAVCQVDRERDPASVLLVRPATRARLIDHHHHHSASPQSVISIGEGRGGGETLAPLLVDPVQLSMGVTADRDDQSQDITNHCLDSEIELRTQLVAEPLGNKDQVLSIVVVQTIPFDQCSCAMSSAPTALCVISLQRLTGPAMRHKHSPPHPGPTWKRIHAPHSNEIHEVGVSTRGAGSLQDGRQREVRGADPPPAQGGSGVTEVCVRENSPEGTAVATARLLLEEEEEDGGNGVTVSYSIENVVGQPFAIDASTGVITTSGEP